jgi:hypothetical protein
MYNEAMMAKAMADTYATTLSIRQVAKEHKTSYHMARKLLAAAGVEPRHQGRPTNDERKETKPVVGGRVRARQTQAGAWKPGTIKRYFLTCAQNNTALHDQVWQNVLGLSKFYDAELLVARTVYNRFARASQADKKLIIEKDRDITDRQYWWDEKVVPFLHDERMELAPGLVWCGETNITPTAADPMSGFDAYTGRASSIFPHARVHMRSVPSMRDEGTKLMYTTGTVTQRNYIQRKAGQLADFHHAYGGLLVEIDRDGTWFVRQVIATNKGVMCDLDKKIDAKSHITTGNRLLGINWGDIHEACGDEEINELYWGEGGVLDELNPQFQFMHDLSDFRARNGHNIKRNLHLAAFIEHTLGNSSVEREMAQTARFLKWVSRDTTQTVVVDSNHDNFFVEWLERTGDFRKDHTNALYFLRAAHVLWSGAERNKGVAPNMVAWAMRDAWRKDLFESRGTREAPSSDRIRFLDEDESFIIGATNRNDGIECGLHGHEGFNGARAGPKAFSRLGRPLNAGHVHSAGIWDDAWFAGITGNMNQRYNVGLGGWSHSNILTYETTKRAMQTIYNGKARV